ncbi:hypothetical protein TWF751_009897 [Orbilia oligospora]|nr:hypothetical protein TWF751_009897 [Orbilia oligospora]
MSETESIPDEDILLMLRLSYWIGSASPKYSNLPILRIIEKYSALVLAQNGTLYPEDLTEYFGTPPSDIPGFLKIIGGIDNLSGWTPIIAEYQYLLPHPRNIGIILPLFVVFLAVTSIAVALRMISRHRVGGGLRSFDWLTLAAHLMAVAYGGLAFHSSRLIGPYEAWYDRTWDSIYANSKVALALTLFYPLTMMTIKLSLCLFYYRMTTMAYIQWGVWVTSFIIIGNTIAGFFVSLFQCSPINNWDSPYTATCRRQSEQRKVLIAMGAIYIFTDVLVWALPIPMVFQLKLYPRQRILALCTFGVGAFAVVASGFRLSSLIDNLALNARGTSTLIIDAWTIIEMNVALLCACAPAIRALVIFLKPKVLSKVGSTSGPSRSASTKASSNPKEKKEIVTETEKTNTKV